MQGILVLGLGNVFKSDDGVGVRVIEMLRELALPEEVEVCDGGIAAPDLHALAGRQKVIAVDAVRGGARPGTIYRLSVEDVEATLHRPTSVHGIGLLETMAMAWSLDCAPRQVVIFGVEPDSVDWGRDLSPEVAAAAPVVVEMVVREIELTQCS